MSRQLSTNASYLPFVAPATLQLHSHSTTMLIKLRLAGITNCGAILRHLILDATLGCLENRLQGGYQFWKKFDNLLFC